MERVEEDNDIIYGKVRRDLSLSVGQLLHAACNMLQLRWTPELHLLTSCLLILTFPVFMVVGGTSCEGGERAAGRKVVS